MANAMLIEPARLLGGHNAVVVDCRFALSDPLAGRRLYEEGHIPGAHYLDLNRDLSGPVATHRGRHPLPDAAMFAATLARIGIVPDTEVVAYDDSRLAFAARLWWLMRAMGYRPPRLLSRGLSGIFAGRRRAGARRASARAVHRPWRSISSGTAILRVCALPRAVRRCWLTPVNRTATRD
ncbi:MAG: rhodanese-like domain-containing protein [Halioglobus sp.]